MQDPATIELLVHDDGVIGARSSRRIYERAGPHDPRDLDAARAPRGATRPHPPRRLLPRRTSKPRYDEIAPRPAALRAEETHPLLNAELDRYAV